MDGLCWSSKRSQAFEKLDDRQQLLSLNKVARYFNPNLGGGRGGISDFRIPGQPFINENCHNSRTSHDIDMKLGPVTKTDNGNTSTSRKFYYDVMSGNCDVLIFFPIYGQLAAIRKPDSGRMVYKTYIFINNNLLPYKKLKQN